MACKCLLVLIVVPALMFGCGTGKKAATDTANPTVAKKPRLPGSFPHNFPLPAGGKLLGAKFEMDAGGETVNLATWEIKSSAAEVIASYRRDLSARGWQITSVTGTDEPDMAFTKSGDPGESHIKVVNVQGKRLLQVRVY